MPSDKPNYTESRKSVAGDPRLAGNCGIFTGRTVCTVFYLSDGRLFASCECLRLAVVPGIKEYVVSRTPVKKPADIFFSLGDRECRTQNSLLRCVQQNTESIERYYHEQGIDTTFQLNPGNHFKDVVQRTAAGLQWLLSREYDP